jgi:hypothetical protein
MQVYGITEDSVDSRNEKPSRVDASARPLVATGPTKSDVDLLLADALAKAAAVGQWDVVAQLASELEARRLVASGEVATKRPPADVESD